MSASRRPLLVAVAIVATALVLRLAGLSFGLPMAEARPDELTIAFQAMKFGRGDLNPHSFNYPSLFKYLVFVAFGGWYAVGRALGVFAGQEDFLRAFFAGATAFRLAMRLISALAGTAGVALLLRTPGGAWGALALAVSFLHVRDSHFGVTDVTLTTLVTAGVLLARRAAGSARLRDAVLAGVVCGLATSTKYNAAVLGLPLVLAAGPRRAVPAVLAMGAAFLVGTPHALLDAPTFVHDVRYEAEHLARGQFVDVGGGWLHHLTFSLPHAVGVPVLVLGVAGAVRHARSAPRDAALLLSFPLIYLLLIGKGEVAFLRYALPMLPFLCLFAGVAIAGLPARARLPVGLLAVAPTLWASVQADRLFLAGDTRAAMGAWIEGNVPTGATIVHAGAYTGAPMLQRNVANQTREYLAKQGRADAAGFRKPDESKWYQAERPMYDVLFVRKDGIDFASQVDVADLVAAPPAWLEVEDYPLVHYAAVPDAVRALAAGCVLAHEEAAYTAPTAAAFDQQDAFYMPVSHFLAFSRMGPTLRLYRCGA